MADFTLAVYRSFLWMVEYELAIAKATGRSRESIAAIKDDISKLESAIADMEINHVAG